MIRVVNSQSVAIQLAVIVVGNLLNITAQKWKNLQHSAHNDRAIKSKTVRIMTLCYFVEKSAAGIVQ